MADLSDYAWLVGAEGATWLASLANDARTELQQLAALRRDLSTERARLVVEQVGLRRRAVDKFGDLAGRMFFTRVHLEQATDLWIARYKAGRMGAASLIGDYCCGIGGDLLALAERAPSIACDKSDVACVIAEANVRNTATVRCGDVESLTPADGEVWHLDPDRRAGSGRSTAVDRYEPGPELVDRWLATNPDGVVKLAPAAEAPATWDGVAELEWITRDRECRQQVAWFGRLAGAPGQRRATTVGRDGQTATLLGAPGVRINSVEKVAKFLYDPDPSILAADLLGALAAKHCLESLGAGSAYLTGDVPIHDALVACFEVLEELAPRPATLSNYFAERGVGRLEIKKRGVAVDPEAFRRQLKLRGDHEATLVLTRIGRRDVAIVGRRVPA